MQFTAENLELFNPFAECTTVTQSQAIGNAHRRTDSSELSAWVVEKRLRAAKCVNRSAEMYNRWTINPETFEAGFEK